MSGLAAAERTRPQTRLYESSLPFLLEAGGRLERLALAYETWGRPSPSGDNAILVCHALTGSAHASSFESPPGSPPGWWDGVIGPGAAIDTDRHYVICANVPGGCYGSSGPGSIDPATGSPYGETFPTVTVRDMVRVHRLLLDHLGIRRLAAVVGGSLGAMAAWQWAVEYPGYVARVIPVAGTPRATAWVIALNEIQRRAITLDPAWGQGRFPREGLSLARAAAMVSYRSQPLFEERFALRRVDGSPSSGLDPDNAFQVGRYLLHHGEKLAGRFDARSYLLLTRAMDLHDVGRGRGGLDAALRRIRAEVLAVGIDSDLLFPSAVISETINRLRLAGKKARYREIRSPMGHDAFLVETDQLNEVIGAFLEEEDSPCAS